MYKCVQNWWFPNTVNIIRCAGGFCVRFGCVCILLRFDVISFEMCSIYKCNFTETLHMNFNGNLPICQTWACFGFFVHIFAKSLENQCRYTFIVNTQIEKSHCTPKCLGIILLKIYFVGFFLLLLLQTYHSYFDRYSTDSNRCNPIEWHSIDVNSHFCFINVRIELVFVSRLI